MKKLLFILILLVNVLSCFSQTIVELINENGISKIPCKINGLDLTLIFDTGASDVSLSLTEALFMFKNGYLKETDILEKSSYSDASGHIGVNTIVNINEIIIAGVKLSNVRAGIVDKLNAPILLGQTAIRKLGVIQLDLENNKLTILNGKPNSGNQISKFKIGQKYGGGKIFYIDETGEHGLIAAEEDQFRGEIFWQDGTERFSGAINMSIGNGKINTEKIVQRNIDGEYPGKICSDLKLNKYDDWYLPSLNELEELYKQRFIVGEFLNYYYWSSSEVDKETIWLQGFATGRQKAFNKKEKIMSAIRAIRSF